MLNTILSLILSNVFTIIPMFDINGIMSVNLYYGTYNEMLFPIMLLGSTVGIILYFNSDVFLFFAYIGCYFRKRRPSYFFYNSGWFKSIVSSSSIMFIITFFLFNIDMTISLSFLGYATIFVSLILYYISHQDYYNHGLSFRLGLTVGLMYFLSIYLFIPVPVIILLSLFIFQVSYNDNYSFLFLPLIPTNILIAVMLILNSDNSNSLSALEIMSYSVVSVITTFISLILLHLIINSGKLNIISVVSIITGISFVLSS